MNIRPEFPPIEVVPLNEFMDRTFPQEGPVIERLLRKKEMIILSATAKTGKSMLAANIALTVATGASFLNRFKTTRGKVLLWQTEVSDANLQSRMRIMLRDYETPADVFVANRRIRLDEPEGRAVLKTVLTEIGPDLLIIDPLYTMHRADENKANEIAPMLTDLRDVVREAGAACIVIHHQGKQYEGRSSRQTGFQHRGTSAFADVPDGSWSLNGKKGRKGAELSFELRNDYPPEPLTVVMDEALWWQLTEQPIEVGVKKATPEAIATLVEGESSKEDLVHRTSEAFKISRRTAEGKINDAVKAGLLKRRSKGRQAVFSKT